jgi:hypothetical protein
MYSGVLQSEGSFDLPFITQVVNTLSYTTGSTSGTITVNSCDMPVLNKYVTGITDPLALLSSSSSSPSSSHVVTSSSASSTVHMPVLAPHKLHSAPPLEQVVDISLSSDEEDEDDKIIEVREVIEEHQRPHDNEDTDESEIIDMGGGEFYTPGDDEQVQQMSDDEEVVEISEQTRPAVVTDNDKEAMSCQGWGQAIKEIITTSVKAVSNTLTMPAIPVALSMSQKSSSTVSEPSVTDHCDTSSSKSNLSEEVNPLTSAVTSMNSNAVVTITNLEKAAARGDVNRMRSSSSDATTTGAISPISTDTLYSTGSTHATSIDSVPIQTTTSAAAAAAAIGTITSHTPSTSKHVSAPVPQHATKNLQERNQRVENDLNNLMNEILQSQPVVPVTSNLKFKCDICSKTFATKSGKLTHMRFLPCRDNSRSLEKQIHDSDEACDIVTQVHALEEDSVDIASSKKYDNLNDIEIEDVAGDNIPNEPEGDVNGEDKDITIAQGRAKRKSTFPPPQYNPPVPLTLNPAVTSCVPKKLRRDHPPLIAPKLTSQNAAQSTHILLTGLPQPESQRGKSEVFVQPNCHKSSLPARSTRLSSSSLSSLSSLSSSFHDDTFRADMTFTLPQGVFTTAGQFKSGEIADKEYLGVFYCTSAARYKAKLHTP